MRTNYVLLAFVLLSLSFWGAAQFVAPSVQYYYREAAPLKYQRGIACYCFRGYIELDILANDNVVYAGACPLFCLQPMIGRAFAGLDVRTINGCLLIRLPYWLVALPPALWLAWRLCRAHKRDGQGFEVATA